MVDKVALGQVFLRVLQFSSQYNYRNAPNSSSFSYSSYRNDKRAEHGSNGQKFFHIQTSEFKRLRKDSRVGKTEKKLKDKFRRAHKPTGWKQVDTCFEPVGLCAFLNLSFSFFSVFPTLLSFLNRLNSEVSILSEDSILSTRLFACCFLPYAKVSASAGPDRATQSNNCLQ